MADLRDQLLKAGLIDRKTKQAADTEARREKKKKKKKGKTATEEADAARLAEWEAARQRQAAENREREASRRLETEAKAQQHRLANLAGAWAIREVRPGTKRWCFVTRAGRIQWIYVGRAVAEDLTNGAVAIVERPADPDEPYAIVPRRIAERIAALDPDAIRFWNRDGPDPEDHLL